MKNDIRDNPAADDEMTTVEGAASMDPAKRDSTNSVGAQAADRLLWAGKLAQPATAVIAVVDKDGYLVPLHTAGDLLRAFKTIWSVGEDRS